MMKMTYNIWAIEREGFCWLNENEVIVISKDSGSNGHCVLLDTVSRVFTTYLISIRTQLRLLQ